MQATDPSVTFLLVLAIGAIAGFFARIEGSYTAITSGTVGSEFARNFHQTGQFRGLIEGGLMF